MHVMYMAPCTASWPSRVRGQMVSVCCKLGIIWFWVCICYADLGQWGALRGSHDEQICSQVCPRDLEAADPCQDALLAVECYLRNGCTQFLHPLCDVLASIRPACDAKTASVCECVPGCDSRTYCGGVPDPKGCTIGGGVTFTCDQPCTCNHGDGCCCQGLCGGAPNGCGGTCDGPCGWLSYSPQSSQAGHVRLPGYFVEQGHGLNQRCYSSSSEAKSVCQQDPDCRAVVTQSDLCAGGYRVTSGLPTLWYWPGWQQNSLWGWQYTRNYLGAPSPIPDKCDPFCGANAVCVSPLENDCRCEEGYKGSPPEESCVPQCTIQECHQWATCVKPEVCVCRPTFQGDGLFCQDINGRSGWGRQPGTSFQVDILLAVFFGIVVVIAYAVPVVLIVWCLVRGARDKRTAQAPQRPGSPGSPRHPGMALGYCHYHDEFGNYQRMQNIRGGSPARPSTVLNIVLKNDIDR